MAQNARASALQNSGTRQEPRDVLALIGHTPLLRLQRVGADFPGVEFYAKAEWANPGGSVKDRPAMNIIREAERAGLMTKDKILIDSTSGNTGIAYAMICAARGYRLRLFVPSNVSQERRQILKAYGAEIVYTDPMEGSDGTIRKVREMAIEAAYAMTVRLAREEGLLVGVSAGAAMVACLKVAQKFRRGVFVTLFPDSGDKYLSERFWDEAGG